MLVQIKRKFCRHCYLKLRFFLFFSGLIQPIFAERLRDMGKWLSTNGQAIYQSQPWIYQNDTTTPNLWYTTSSSSPSTLRRNVYAIVLDYPYDSSNVELYSLFGQTDENTTISMLGYPHALKVGIFKCLLNCEQ